MWLERVTVDKSVSLPDSFRFEIVFPSSAAQRAWETLTFRQEGRDQARHSGQDVAGCEGETASETLDGQEDEEGGRQLHDPGDEEVHVEVAAHDAQAHDQPLVHHRAGEPARHRTAGGARVRATPARRGERSCKLDTGCGTHHKSNLPSKHQNQGALPHLGSSHQV